jgi:hypothetical protein
MQVEVSEFIISILSMAFGLWAGVVAWIGHGIRSDLKDISVDLKSESIKLNTYIVQTEKRLAIIETAVGLNNGRKRRETDT